MFISTIQMTRFYFKVSQTTSATNFKSSQQSDFILPQQLHGEAILISEAFERIWTMPKF